MNGQFLMNKAISVQYAFKKDGKGERHGTPAERLLAAQARKNNALPLAARPPPAPMAFGARPPMQPLAPGQYPQGYQGQFAGVLAPPPPPVGFAPRQTMMAPGQQPPAPPLMNMYPNGMIPMGMPMGMIPPPPPGFGAGGMGMQPGFQGMPMMGGPPPPPPYMTNA